MTPDSLEQKALFFALAREHGKFAASVKERAQHHVDLASFTDITTKVLSALINRLLAVQARRRRASAADASPS